MIARGLSLAFCLAAQPALALSCMPAEVARSYLEADAAEETYVIGLGRFSFPEEALAPVPVSPELPEDRHVTATFEGRLFSGKGFDFETVLDVEITARCLGHWCAALEPRIEMLVFLEDRAGGYALTVTPCGGRAFPNPSPEDIAQVRACHEGKACAPLEEL